MRWSVIGAAPRRAQRGPPLRGPGRRAAGSTRAAASRRARDRRRQRLSRARHGAPRHRQRAGVTAHRHRRALHGRRARRARRRVGDPVTLAQRHAARRARRSRPRRGRRGRRDRAVRARGRDARFSPGARWSSATCPPFRDRRRRSRPRAGAQPGGAQRRSGVPEASRRRAQARFRLLFQPCVGLASHSPRSTPSWATTPSSSPLRRLPRANLEHHPTQNAADLKDPRRGNSNRQGAKLAKGFCPPQIPAPLSWRPWRFGVLLSARPSDTSSGDRSGFAAAA